MHTSENFDYPWIYLAVFLAKLKASSVIVRSKCFFIL
jgi:hypothetical protein